MRYLGSLLSLLATVLASGCATTWGQLKGDAASPAGDESIFIIGVAPPNHRLFIFSGNVVDGKFEVGSFSPAVVLASAKDGYVVAKVKGGEVLGIADVEVVQNESQSYGTHYFTCDSVETMVFEVPRGRVIYLADIRFQAQGTRLASRYEVRVDQAAAHMRSNFPNVKAPVEQHPYKMLPMPRKCTGPTLTIPIYVGK
jgi:hypothetical protein